MANNFRVGQKVVCIKKGAWVYTYRENKIKGDGPAYGDIVKIILVMPDGYIQLEGFIDYYNPVQFRPIDESEKFAEQIIKKLETQQKKEVVYGY